MVVERIYLGRLNSMKRDKIKFYNVSLPDRMKSELGIIKRGR